MMLIEEERQVRFGRTVIDYGIRRSPRRQTVSVAVDPDLGVLLTAPTTAPAERLDQLVRDKAPWIVDRLRHLAQPERRPEPRAFVSGESFPYLGRHYRLKVTASADPDPAKLSGGFLHVPVARALPKPDRPAAVATALRQWYRDRATARLPQRLAQWSPRVGVPTPQLLIADQDKRWGSCDPAGTVRLNWKILGAPMRLVDYVVAHELVHLVHRDHTKAFWKRLGQAMPDYDRRKEELRRLGPRLQW